MIFFLLYFFQSKPCSLLMSWLKKQDVMTDQDLNCHCGHKIIYIDVWYEQDWVWKIKQPMLVCFSVQQFRFRPANHFSQNLVTSPYFHFREKSLLPKILGYLYPWDGHVLQRRNATLTSCVTELPALELKIVSGKYLRNRMSHLYEILYKC